MVTIERFAYLEKGTVGKLTIDDWSCYTIERPWLSNKSNISCIPEGTYKCEPFTGSKFKDVVQIMDVPGRSFILFHIANYPGDIEGCIGVGNSFDINDLSPMVYNSRVTLADFFVAAGKSFDLEIKGVRAEI
tara:strand:- start:41 stop:436 length:396 start_codon:yes stop_codon:yes gene_type:complete